MLIFIAVCVGILAVTHVIALAILMTTAAQMRRAAQAVEVLAYRAQDQITQLSHATEKVRDFTFSLRSNWLRALTTAMEALMVFRSRRSGAQEAHVKDGG